MTATPNPNLEAALHHARAGRPVFPCSGVDKRPSISKKDGGRGFKDAATDEALIRAWWERYPDAVPGMPTGGRVGVWVLDVDSKPGKVGRETLATLVSTFGPLPETVETLTATGGSHIYFRHPRDGRTVPNSASMLGRGSETWGSGGYPAVPFEVAPSGKLRTPDLDVRGDGGYVILPGSVMADGRRYEWEGSSDPDEGVRVAPAPDWLLALVAHDPQALREPPAGGDAKAVERIGEGGRNDHLYRLGCSLRSKGCPESVIVAALLADNAERCDPPLPAAEVLATAKSAADKPLGLSAEYEAKRRQRPLSPSGTVGDDARYPPTPTMQGEGSSPGGGSKKGVLPYTGAPLPAAPSPSSAGAETTQPPQLPPAPPDWPESGSSGRPSIQIVDGELPAMIDDAEHYLMEAGVGLYQRGDQGLVRVAAYPGAPQPGLKSRASEAVLIQEVHPEWLGDQMTRCITWQRWDSRSGTLRRKDAPTKVATGLLARGGAWKFRYLGGFTHSPLIDLSGRLISAPGYDAGSGLYLVDPPEIEPIGTTDRYLAEWAGESLCNLLGIGQGVEPDKFPFQKPCDVAAAMASVMTAILRPILPTAPICAISAATPGTGKSLWVDCVSVVARGTKATVINMGGDAEETEKRIGSQLQLGESFSFDNIEGAFRSDALCTVATQESINVRMLGTSRMARLPTRVQIWLTGNNVTPLGDLARRTMLARLDAGCERPELREFTVDAISRARENRAQVIRCALALTKAYLDAGEPKLPAPPTGSFGEWDRMVRYPLLWAGYGDCLGRAEDLREADHSLAGIALLMVAWRRVHAEPITASELYELIVEQIPRMSGGMTAMHPDLHDAAVQIRGDPRKWTPRDLGYVLREASDRPLGGLAIRNKGKSKRGVLWAVEDAT